jgi:protein TonB
MFALQDEPEKATRLLIFAVGALVAVGLQGGALWAANEYRAPPREKSELVTFELVKVPPKPKVAEPPPPPPTAPPPPPPPKPKAPPTPKPKTPEPPPTPINEPPKPVEPPKTPVPIQTGLSLDSTVQTGAGPAFQVGNTQMGEVGRVARTPVTQTPPPAVPAERGPPGPPVVVGAKLVGKPTPGDVYTAEAKSAEIEGDVILVVTVDEKGVVVTARVVKGLGYGLDERAVQLAMKHRYAPRTVDGVPQRSQERLAISFRLEDF